MTFLTVYRPEKDHAAQLHAFKSLLENYPEFCSPSRSIVKLVLLGGSRNPGDAVRVESLKKLAVELGIDVCTLANGSYSNSNQSSTVSSRIHRQCVIPFNVRLAAQGQYWP